MFIVAHSNPPPNIEAFYANSIANSQRHLISYSFFFIYTFKQVAGQYFMLRQRIPESISTS